MSKKHLLILLVLYVLSVGVAYGVMMKLNKNAANTGTAQTATTTTGSEGTGAPQGQTALAQLITVSPSDPKNQQCPLNGKMYTQPEEAAWAQRRPLAIMIENSPDARPQSGLSSADIIFEAMAEGGVTRFQAYFYCEAQHADVQVAPVRSVREYFFHIAEGFYRPLLVHVGGANTPGPADALGMIADAGWNQQNDMNQFSIGYPTFWRDYNRLPGKTVATEHTMVSTTEGLWKVATQRGWTNVAPAAAGVAPKSKTAAASSTPAGSDWLKLYQPWAFQDGTPNAGTVTDISFDFWNGFDTYGVHWQYDPANNAYKRFMAGQPHVDLNTNQQIEVKNAVVLFMIEKGPIDELKHMLYTTEGTGDALIFQNGQAVKAKWSKATETSQLTFTDAATGKPVQFVRGLTWFSIVSPDTKVTY